MVAPTTMHHSIGGTDWWGVSYTIYERPSIILPS